MFSSPPSETRRTFDGIELDPAGLRGVSLSRFRSLLRLTCSLLLSSLPCSLSLLVRPFVGVTCFDQLLLEIGVVAMKAQSAYGDLLLGGKTLGELS